MMPFWVITATGKVLSRTTVQRVTNLELQLEENKTKCLAFTAALQERLGNDQLAELDDNGELIIPDEWNDPAFSKEFIEEFGRTINNPTLKEADQEFTPDAYDDTYLNME